MSLLHCEGIVSFQGNMWPGPKFVIMVQFQSVKYHSIQHTSGHSINITFPPQLYHSMNNVTVMIRENNKFSIGVCTVIWLILNTCGTLEI